jgi:NAD(P)-dependent dehydrogenase (short-subunit alcohol dehydrogenase family)
VAVHYRASEQPARELANEVRAIGRNSQVFHSDLSLAGGVETLTTEVAADFGPIDLLVLSASNYAKEPFLDITPEGFAETLQVNLLAPFFLAQKFGAQMMARGHGQIDRTRTTSPIRSRKPGSGRPRWGSLGPSHPWCE